MGGLLASSLATAQSIDQLDSLLNASQVDQLADPLFLRRVYKKYITILGRDYSESRFRNFQNNVSKIVKNNLSGSSWTAGLNEHTDKTFAEFRAQYLFTVPQNCSATVGSYLFRGAAIPDSIDWRDRDSVSPVKNQGGCGSCWAFSTNACLEAHWKIYKNEWISFSEQQLVDCAGDFDNNGCSGGLPSHAFEYLRYSGGIQNGTTYPYTARDGKCKFDPTKVVAKVPGGSVNVTALDEHALDEAIAEKGPVSIAFQVVSDFMNYKTGVYTSSRCQNGAMDVNHAVLAVGYGFEVDTGKKYYIVKNSWGAGWGDKGYFKIERGINMCGVAQCNSFPDLVGQNTDELEI